MATNSPAFTHLHPRLRGSEEKSITVPSGAGSGVNEVLDKCVRGRKGVRKGGKKILCVCERVYECVLHKGWSRETVTKGLVGTSVRLVRDQIYDH